MLSCTIKNNPIMKIKLAKSAGFCFGVKRALDIAFRAAKSGRKVYMLGDIVHNEDVVREIEKSGIKKIGRLACGKNRTLLICAHGAPIDIFKKARESGYKIVDATCPMVRHIHRIAQRMERQGCRIIVIGDRNHVEVRGIVGQLKGKTIIIDGLKSLPKKTIKSIKKACVVVQSTQDLENALKIADFLKSHIKELRFFNTICTPTRSKQGEIKKMARQNEAMIIIGSKTSANTKRLYEISKSLNNRSYWVQSRKDIKPGWFAGIKTVGITAGASTPDDATEEVINYIKKIT
jgi:4-hydroxy-3-methylbut-2-enyl diphosphate reductase